MQLQAGNRIEFTTRSFIMAQRDPRCMCRFEKGYDHSPNECVIAGTLGRIIRVLPYPPSVGAFPEDLRVEIELDDV